MTESSARVVIVDDDSSVRRSLARLLRVHGYATESCSSAEEFLARGIQAACLILDLKMPEIDGMQLQNRLMASGADIAIIFLTGHGDIPTSVTAMKRGAVDFLTKPVDEVTLIEAVRTAIQQHANLRGKRAMSQAVEERLAILTPRETEVMRGVITGAMNKQIAGKLGISEKTVKVHRAHVMEKMQVQSVAELVHLCALANLLPDNQIDHHDRRG